MSRLVQGGATLRLPTALEPRPPAGALTTPAQERDFAIRRPCQEVWVEAGEQRQKGEGRPQDRPSPTG